MGIGMAHRMPEGEKAELLREWGKDIPQSGRSVLVVDDDWQVLGFLDHVLKQAGYKVLMAESGEEALQALNASHQEISLVLLDMQMGGITGLEVAKEMQKKPEWSLIPVIMQTASNRPDVVRQGIAAGVYYCLHKPLNPDLLVAIVDAAIQEFAVTQIQQEAIANQKRGMSLLDTGRFACRTLEEVDQLADLLAHGFPDPQRAIIGVTELLINAVEHGNLGITYDEKSQLVRSGRWRETVEARQALPQYAEKKVEVVFQRKADGVYLQITDEGAGFEWWRYLEIDPARANHPNGRGIALANKISFDQLQFTNDGSRVLGVVLIGREVQKTGLVW